MISTIGEHRVPRGPEQLPNQTICEGLRLGTRFWRDNVDVLARDTGQLLGNHFAGSQQRRPSGTDWLVAGDLVLVLGVVHPLEPGPARDGEPAELHRVVEVRGEDAVDRVRVADERARAAADRVLHGARPEDLLPVQPEPPVEEVADPEVDGHLAPELDPGVVHVALRAPDRAWTGRKPARDCRRTGAADARGSHCDECSAFVAGGGGGCARGRSGRRADARCTSRSRPHRRAIVRRRSGKQACGTLDR